MNKFLRRNEWALVAGAAVVAFLLGFMGMRGQVASEGEVATWADAAYFSLRLFTVSYDFPGKGASPYATDNWPLEIARFLAPATLAYAVVKGLLLAAASQFNLWRVSRWTGHAVICGGGERGRQLAIALRNKGQKVVVIEKDEHAETLADVRAAGARVIVGSGVDPARQAEARLAHAGIVAAVTPCVESNLQVVLAASRRTTGLPLRAMAHASRSFAEMFETQPPFDRIVERKECGFFDHDVAASRLLAAKYALVLVPALASENRAARLLVVGDGDILPELLGVLLTQCQYAGPEVPRIDLMIPDAVEFGREFPITHPQLRLVADLAETVMPLSQLIRLDLATVRRDVRDRPYDLAFVACRQDTDTLALSRNLGQQAGSILHDVVAGLRPSTQLMRLFINNQPLAGVQTHDLVALGCSADIVLYGELDKVARDIHEKYVAEQVAAGCPLGSAAALTPWEELPGGLRQANRSQADHIPIKRRTLELSRSEAMIEALAMAEHRRWMAEKIVAGWRYAPSRDDARRLHPSIRPYDELSEAERQKDRNTVLAVISGG